MRLEKKHMFTSANDGFLNAAFGCLASSEGARYSRDKRGLGHINARIPVSWSYGGRCVAKLVTILIFRKRATEMPLCHCGPKQGSLCMARGLETDSYGSSVVANARFMLSAAVGG